MKIKKINDYYQLILDNMIFHFDEYGTGKYSVGLSNKGIYIGMIVGKKVKEFLDKMKELEE